MLKFTIITPVYQGEETIRTCIESVLAQSHPNVEYIIMDAKSTDHTLKIISSFSDSNIRLISEKDKGLYDAFNKGIKMATGDIICFLCADDMYATPEALKKVAATFQMYPEADIVYSDIVYVNRENPSQIERYWKSSPFRPGLYRKGWLPPNTSFYIKRKSLEGLDYFNIHFPFAADYEFNYRLLEKNNLKAVYLPDILVMMRSGGISNSGFNNMYKSLKDCYAVLRYHHVRHPWMYIFNTIVYRFKQMFVPEGIKKQFKETVYK
jgi:glycosyltransferase involved in cell wall biosynthesis